MSSTTTTGTATNFEDAFSSWNRGPLTTLFTPPVSCLNQTTITVLTSTTTILQGHYGIGDSNCYPFQAGNRPGPLDWGDYYYSPGICPQGWTSACSQSTSQAGLATTLASSTHAIVCCPEGGWECGTLEGHQCINNLAAGQTLTHVWNLGSTGSITYSQNTIVNTKSLQTYVIETATSAVADGIPVWWRDVDLASFPTTTTTSMSTTSTSTPVQTSPASSTPTPSAPASSGLSTGAKVAIGVVVPIVIIAAVLGIFFFIRRRKQRERQNGGIIDHSGHAGQDPYMGAFVPIQNKDQYLKEPVEADASHYMLSELPSQQAGTNGPAELSVVGAAAIRNANGPRERSPYRPRDPLPMRRARDEQGTPLLSAHERDIAAPEQAAMGGLRSRETVEQKEAKLERLKADIERVRRDKETLTTLQELEAMEAQLKKEIVAQQRETMSI